MSGSRANSSMVTTTYMKPVVVSSANKRTLTSNALERLRVVTLSRARDYTRSVTFHVIHVTLHEKFKVIMNSDSFAHEQ